MSEQNLDKDIVNQQDGAEPVILRNELGGAPDPNVVVDEADRTILLTKDEAIIIEKEPQFDIAPVNRARKVYTGMFGPVEIGVLGAGMLAVLGAVLLYVFFVVPSNAEVESQRTRRQNLETELASTREKFGNIENVEHRVGELIDSVNSFESNYLPVPTTGRTALYQRINGLINAYSLVNSSGPDYSPLEILDDKKAAGNEEKSGKSKFRSFFPGVYVSMTVEGPYPNLRRFIRELETGSEFVVVSAVELEPSDSQEKQRQDQGNPTQAAPMESGFDPITLKPTAADPTTMSAQAQANLPNSYRGKTHGAIVSLRIEMAAYFRRPSLEAVPADPAQQQ